MVESRMVNANYSPLAVCLVKEHIDIPHPKSLFTIDLTSLSISVTG